jgi:hypothetical protein
MNDRTRRQNAARKTRARLWSVLTLMQHLVVKVCLPMALALPI